MRGRGKDEIVRFTTGSRTREEKGDWLPAL